jgi:hypothetical protein
MPLKRKAKDAANKSKRKSKKARTCESQEHESSCGENSKQVLLDEMKALG